LSVSGVLLSAHHMIASRHVAWDDRDVVHCVRLK